jgi:hypothetical protein
MLWLRASFPAVGVIMSEDSISTVAPPNRYVTYDTEVTDHLISDDQLMRLVKGAKDRSYDIFLASVGVAVGLFQNIISVISSVIDGKAIDAWPALATGGFIVSATIAAVNYFSAKAVKADTDAIVTQIKNRKRGIIPDGSSTATRGLRRG